MSLGDSWDLFQGQARGIGQAGLIRKRAVEATRCDRKPSVNMPMTAPPWMAGDRRPGFAPGLSPAPGGVVMRNTLIALLRSIISLPTIS
jgi:hypothetical protein